MILEVTVDGRKLLCEPKTKLPNGNWIAQAMSDHPRIGVGSVFELDGAQVNGGAVGSVADALVEAINAPQQGGPMADMNEIAGLADLTGTLNELKQLAKDAAAKFRGSAENLKTSIGHTHSAAEQLDAAAKSIRDTLGVKSNGGPA